MPDVATAPTATAAQTQAAGSRILGYYLGGGGVKVDCLFDTSNFMVKDGDGTYRATPAANKDVRIVAAAHDRSEEHTSELQSLMRISYAVFCLKKKKKKKLKH